MQKLIITGGAGFIGSNLAHARASAGDEVLIIDDFSRASTELNAAWLAKEFPQVLFEKVDISKPDLVRRAVLSFGPDSIVHLAGQVAVTNSLADPRRDFEINVSGTFGILEAVRDLGKGTSLIFASTNKVYGALETVSLESRGKRWEAINLSGVSERQQLDFVTPYGCSKGAADQYVLDYGRQYGLRTTVLRQSCVYGPRQFGLEDQGWVAWFVLAALRREPIQIFGDGMQVRDLLYVEDLVELYSALLDGHASLVPRAYNVGGGMANATSLLEFLDHLENKLGHEIEVEFRSERPGDQRWFVSDNSLVARKIGWSPKTSITNGLSELIRWAKEIV